MSDDQPFFRFYPGAYEDGASFERSDELCEVCSKPCRWKYTGGIYGEEEPIVCARCIASGALSKFLGEDAFDLHDIQIEGAEPSLETELRKRTPGVSSFNPFDWPVLDGKPLAFVGYGDDKALLSIAAVKAAIRQAFEDVGEEFEGPTPYALIFKEIDGNRYQVMIDVD